MEIISRAENESTMAKNELDKMSLEKRVVLTIDSLEHELEQFKQARTEPVAVIGMGCRFPGGSYSPEAFWQMLAEGRDAVTEMPIERYDIDEFYHPDINMPGKTVSRWGAFLEHIDEFDPGFFGISPREAMFMDPQQRILLEVTWEALERAGVQPEKLMGSSTGVFMGLFNKDYSNCIQDQAGVERGANANASLCSLFPHFASGRISYHLGLQGPSMTVDTACSSSLVAVHLACQSLRNEECQMALAGGVDLRFHPWEALIHSKMRVLSPHGRCRTFDESADGFVRGEGCGVVVLKRYSQAVADGDSILALIRGSAVNSDGRSNGLTAPNGKAQEAVLRQALRNSGVRPEQISYIEAHGTGTRLGDPIEFESLKNVIGQAHPEGSLCMLGSVKTNIGHLEAASGVAGLVKAILCLQHQAIPAHLHLDKLNRLINLEQSPFVIPKHLSPWSSAGPRYAGVSASGLSGTNAHIVLEEISEFTRADHQPLSFQRTGETWLLPLSAKNADGLRQLAQAWRSELQAPNSLSNASLRHICSTASMRRTHYRQRLALVSASHGELTTQLGAFLRKEVAPGMSSGLASRVKTSPVFIFAGQGAQWAGMGQALINQEAVFRTALEKCDALLRKYVSWSLLVELQADEKQSRLHETAIAQPALFSLQVALSELWHSWGIEPAAVVGHSVGEIAAAHVAGVLDLEDAIRIAVQRGALMQQTHGQGYMAAVEICETQAREFLADYAGRVAIAAVNSRTSVVLSGETAALHEVLQNMLQANVPARELNVENAFHSPQMEPLRNPVVESLAGIKPKLAKLLLLSTVTGEPSLGEDCNASYWGRNMCETVCFGPAIEKILDMGYHTFLEISPHPVLARSVKQCLAHQDRSGVIASSMRRGVSERKSMLTALGTLYTHGFPVKWEQIYQTRSWESNKVVPLPTYPWQHKRYWFSDNFKPLSRQAPTATSGRLTGHPLLGRRLRAAARDHIIFETTISTKAYPWLVDHQAFGMPVFPASAYIEMMSESVRMALKFDDVHLTDLFIPQALTLSPDEERVVQLVLVQSSSDNPAGEITILSCSDSDPDVDVWTLHASCHYQRGKQGASISTVAELTDMDTVRQRCTEFTSGVEHYEKMSGTGLELGPAFQGLQHIWWREGEALGKLCLPHQVSSERRSYFIHPTLLDSCIQTAAATVWAKDKKGEYLYLPVSMDRVFFHRRPGTEIWVHTTLSTVDLNHGLNLQMRILSERGELIALIDGIHIRRAPPSALAGQPRLSALNWLYNLQWNQKVHHGVLQTGDYISSANPKSWLFFCDNKGIGTRLAARLRQRGEQCLLIFADQQYQKMNESESYDYTVDRSKPEHLQTLLDECMPLLKYYQCGIVYLWGVDAIMSPEGTSEKLVQEQEKLCGGLFHLVQTVVDKHWATSPELWVMTQNSQDVKVPSVAGTTPSGVLQAQLWGLGRAIAYEHSDLQCRLVDLPDQNSWDTDPLIQELLDPEWEDQIALRMEGRYIARLAVAESDVAFMRKQKQHIDPAQDHTALQFSVNGTYLITGGLGGLGIAIAQWMVEQRGVRHLVLTGRRDPTPEVRSILNRLEQRGAQILLVKTDVADENQVVQLLKTIEGAAVPLRGIIHSAGVLDDGVLVQLNWERFAKVLAPKVQGTWNLHLLTRDIALDFFVLFSSVASIMPVPGQANYAAANAFVDGLAHYRRSLGLPAISVNWGAWADMGMTKDSASFERRLALEGVKQINREQGMVAFEQVLLDDPVQIAVFPIDTSIFKGMRAGKQAPFFLELINGEYPRQSKEALTSDEADKALAYKQIPYAVRFQEKPEIMLQDVSRQALKILGFDPTAHFEPRWNLFEIGLDSFMALELRNAVQKETGLSVPANLVFNHPTVEGIVASLAGQLSPANE